MSHEQHTRERELLENADINDTASVVKGIKKLTNETKGKKVKGDKSNHVVEQANKIMELL